ncbi:hypothetical protein AWB71_05289 [Caballeronia peredens]|nr:hypothetical protein AWB71_05289 [Caballeronia peredens]
MTNYKNNKSHPFDRYGSYLCDAVELTQACAIGSHDVSSCKIQMAFVHLFHFNQAYELHLDADLEKVQPFALTGITDDMEGVKLAAISISKAISRLVDEETRSQDRLIEVFKSTLPGFGFIAIDQTTARPDEWWHVLARKLLDRHAPACTVLIDIRTCNDTSTNTFFTIGWDGTKLKYDSLTRCKDLSDEFLEVLDELRYAD